MATYLMTPLETVESIDLPVALGEIQAASKGNHQVGDVTDNR